MGVEQTETLRNLRGYYGRTQNYATILSSALAPLRTNDNGYITSPIKFPMSTCRSTRLCIPFLTFPGAVPVAAGGPQARHGGGTVHLHKWLDLREGWDRKIQKYLRRNVSVLTKLVTGNPS